MNHLKPYHSYRDSGIPWQGDIPENWTLHRLDRLFTLRNEQPLDDDPRITGYLDGRVTLRSNVISQKIKGVVKDGGWQRVHPGDFAISGMNAHLGGMGVSDSLGKCSPIYLVLIPKKGTNAQFVSRIMRRAAHSGAITALVNTIRYNSADLKRDDLKRFWFCIPPLPEQTTIVQYLNYMDRRINNYINAKKKLIALLNEQKQAIINQAVTKGLDSNVRLKPSGVEWLGDIPEHWEVRRLRNIANMLVSNVDKHSNNEEVTIRLCNYVDVYKNERITGQLAFMSASASQDEVERFRINFGDVLITKDSEEWTDIGVPSFVEYESPDLICGYHLAILRPKFKIILGEYLFRALQNSNVAYQFNIAANGVTRYGLSHLAIKGVSIPIPPISEQQSIIQLLNTTTLNINSAINRAKREIELLREYRTRLIADVVTGKLDVREAAIILPEEIEGELTEDIEPIVESDLLNEEGDTTMENGEPIEK